MAVIRELLLEHDDGTLVYELVTDEADVINENIDRKADGTRGFSPDRHFQHIGSVPCHVWHEHCKKIGYNLMDNASRKKEVIKFLNQFRQWSPVESIRTEQPSEGHIIIK
jgi:hypothetical protein